MQNHPHPFPPTVPPSLLQRMTQRFRGNRRGSALILALVMTLSLAGLATSAVYLAGNSDILATSFDRERDFKYASEAALAMGKSRLNTDALVVPDSGYTTILNNATIPGADGQSIPGVTVNMYIGPTSSNTGQFGRFVSVVTEARDTRGARFVRRLELAQESFAKFAYWSNAETNSGNTIYFGGNDQLWGPVWSNDIIHIVSPPTDGATFHDDVGTAKTISNPGNGTFLKGYSENQHAITLPNNTTLASLPGYASAGSMSFTAPSATGATGALMRLEFESIDLDGDGKVNDTDEGFLKVYSATGTSATSDWLRGDWTTTATSATNCGASFYFPSSATLPTTPSGSVIYKGPYFAPVSAAAYSSTMATSWVPWFYKILTAMTSTQQGFFRTKNGLTSSQYSALTSSPLATILSLSTARCYLGGDPHLAGVERVTNTAAKGTLNGISSNATVTSSNYDAVLNVLGGDSTTWTDSSAYGKWLKWPGTVDSRVQTKRPLDYGTLFPIYRGLNPGTKGVVYVNGVVGVSGTLRGRITLYATGDVAILDDLRYATDPSSGLCGDILGIIGAKNILVADNSLNGPQRTSSTASYRNFNDNNQDMVLQGVMMALNTSFGAENYDQGPTDANGCEGQNNGRGCLYLTGGLIQNARGAVGTFSSSGGTGYTKRYSYDHCALYNPPPYFPTTGRYTDNRYYEIDPSRFNVAQLFRSLTPGP